MRTSCMRLLAQAAPKSKSLTVRLPSAVADDLAAARVAARAAGYELDVTSVVITAVQASVRRARAELAQLGGRP